MQSIAKLFVFAVFTACAVLADDTPAVVKARPETGLPPDLLPNEGVVLLSEAGFSDSFVVVKIYLSRTRFDTSAEGLAFLRRHSISEELVRFILEHEAKPVVDAPPPAPAIIRMKVVKRKVLVPVEPSLAASATFVPSSAPVPAPKAKRAWWPWSSTRWYAPSPAAAGVGSPGYPQVGYTTPGRPLLHSPVFPASAPVLTPLSSPNQ